MDINKKDIQNFDNLSNLQKWMLRLSAPYKKSEAYKTFEKVIKDEKSPSIFWNTEIGYVVEYENAPLNNSKKTNVQNDRKDFDYMDEQHTRIKKSIEEKIEYNLDDLIEKSDKVYKLYREKFSSYNVCGESCFPQVAHNAFYKKREAYWTLTERCIRRKEDIKSLNYYYSKDQEMLNELSDAKVFSEFMMMAIPLEVLWSMEYEKEDDYVFDETEQWAFDYLRVIAEFYLEETQKYEELLDKKQQEDSKKTRTKKKIK